MKLRFYLYAAFFAVVGVVCFAFFITDNGPTSLAALNKTDYPQLMSTEEKLKGERSLSYTLVAQDNQRYTLKDWAPNYQNVVNSIESGNQVVELWSDRNGIVFQLLMSDGVTVAFDDAVNRS